MTNNNMNNDFGREPREYYETMAVVTMADWPPYLQKQQYEQDARFYATTQALDQAEDRMLRVLSGHGDESPAEEQIRLGKLYISELQSGERKLTAQAHAEPRISSSWIHDYIARQMKL